MASGTSTASGENITTPGSFVNDGEAPSIVPTLILFFFGASGNIIAFVILIISSKRHKWKPFYRLVAGLISTDSFGLLSLYPITLRWYTTGLSAADPEGLCKFYSFTAMFTFMASASVVCAMSFDRFMAILYPILYTRFSTSFRINMTLAGIWIFTAVVCSLHLLGLGSVETFYPGSWCFINFLSHDIVNIVGTNIYTSIGLIILIATIIMNVLVIYTVFKSRNQGNIQTRKRKKNNIFIIVYLVLVVVLFTICWTPLIVRMIVNSFQKVKSTAGDLLAIRFSVGNLIFDPWVYLLLRKENASALRRMLKLPCIRRNSQAPTFVSYGRSGPTVETGPTGNETG